MESAGPKKLFKYYLDQKVTLRDNRPLFFRRNMRWRVNSKEYGYPLSKKGLLKGYIKYGVFAYLGWYYFRAAITPSAHHGHHEHGHDSHGDHHAADAQHGSHGHHEEKKHH